MVVALGAHSFAPIPPPAAPQGVGLASQGRPWQGAPGASVSVPGEVWVPPWMLAAEPARDLASKEEQIAGPLAPVKVEYVSPSAIESIGLCERKWGFAKLDRLDKGSMLAAELGTATHAQHERWFLEGVPYDLTTRAGELALATSDLLPPRETQGLRVEQEMRFAWPTISGGLLGGKIDLNWRAPDAVHVVLDHKTSSNVEQYGKLSRDALMHHPQAPVYGAFGLWHSVPGQPADAVELRWNYVNTKGKPKGTPSWHLVRPEEVHDAVEHYVAPGARRLLQIVEQANESRSRGVPFGAKDLPFPDPGKRACTAFGGCPFKSVCGITPARSIVTMVDASQDFLVRMGLAPASLAPAPAVVPAAPPPAPGPAQLPLSPAVTNLAVPPVGYSHSAPASSAPQTMGYGGQVNPPENTLPPPVTQAAAPAPAAPPATDAPKPKKPRAQRTPADPATTTATVAVEGLENLPSFLESAVLAVLPAVTSHMVPLVLAGQFQPSAVGILALEIAKAATAGIES